MIAEGGLRGCGNPLQPFYVGQDEAAIVAFDEATGSKIRENIVDVLPRGSHQVGQVLLGQRNAEAYTVILLLSQRPTDREQRMRETSRQALEGEGFDSVLQCHGLSFERLDHGKRQVGPRTEKAAEFVRLEKAHLGGDQSPSRVRLSKLPDQGQYPKDLPWLDQGNNQFAAFLLGPGELEETR